MRDYWRENFSRSLPRWERRNAMTTLVVAVASVVFSIITALGVSFADWPLKGAVPLGIFVFLISMFGLHVVILTPMAMWKELRDKVAEYEETHLVIFYDDGDQACKRDVYGSNGGLAERLWRVGVRGSMGKLTRGVIVRLAAIEPTVPDLPQALHPMSGKWSGVGSEWEGDGSFDLRPTDVEYVDVLRYVANSGIGTETLQIVLHSFAKPIDLRSYKLTLVARGEEGQGTSRQFEFEVNRKELMRFYPLDEVST